MTDLSQNPTQKFSGIPLLRGGCDASFVSRQHPLLYWTTIAYIVGVPNFLRFDATGRTHDFGLFNITSISHIALTLLTAYILAINMSMCRGPFFPRKLNASIHIWVLLLVWCAIAALLQPQSRLSPRLSTDLPLSLYRLGEWVLAFILFLALYTREPVERATALAGELLGRASWIIVGAVWMMFPFIPDLVYGAGEEGGSGGLLGGVVFGSGPLGIESGIAFFYSLLFLRSGLLKWLSCLLALVTLEMTRSRISLIGFLVVFLIYALFFSRDALVRWATIFCLTLAAFSGLWFRNAVFSYVSRGQTASTIITLDDRTLVWRASVDAIRIRPLLGYGYFVGARDAIRDHWSYQHWLPPNAHNEYIQAMLVGGVPACALVLYIDACLLWRVVRQAKQGATHVFLMLAAILISLVNLTWCILTLQFLTLGAMFLICWIACADDCSLQVLQRYDS